MRQTTGTRKSPGEKIVKDIKRATRKNYSSEDKIRIVLGGLRSSSATHGLVQSCAYEEANLAEFLAAKNASACTAKKFGSRYQKRCFSTESAETGHSLRVRTAA